jgi:branched-chain amino acid transport system ATP-binding protein
MLAVARGLMSEPRILMVDEPSLGLAPIVVEQLYELFHDLASSGLTLVIVEQYVQVALGIADRAYVLDKGVVVLTGTAGELSSSPELIDAYLSSAPEESVA